MLELQAADRAAPLNEIRQRAAQAVPESSLFFMAIPMYVFYEISILIGKAMKR